MEPYDLIAPPPLNIALLFLPACLLFLLGIIFYIQDVKNERNDRDRGKLWAGGGCLLALLAGSILWNLQHTARLADSILKNPNFQVSQAEGHQIGNTDQIVITRLTLTVPSQTIETIVMGKPTSVSIDAKWVTLGEGASRNLQEKGDENIKAALSLNTNQK